MIRSFLFLHKRAQKFFYTLVILKLKTYSKKDHLSSLKISNTDD